jgi:hypothetical protein
MFIVGIAAEPDTYTTLSRASCEPLRMTCTVLAVGLPVAMLAAPARTDPEH